MEETKVHDTNTKTQLSLAAALFFSPLVQNMLNKNTRDITDQEKDFIRGYIKFGYITLLFGIITIASGIMNYIFALDILNVVYTVSIFLLVFLLMISIVSILSDISLLKGGDHTIQNYSVEGNKKDIIFKYLPLYNIYLWYKIHSFDRPNWRIKESLILWTAFLILSFLGNVLISSSALILIIFRISALMSDIDFINIPIKQWLNKLFLKNPEEIRGYLTGLCIYVGKSLVHIFVPIQHYTLEEEIAKEKEAYSRIIDIQGNINILIEYILGIILTIGLVYTLHINFTVRTYYVGLGLLIARYVVMITQLKHLPHLPIVREIMLLVETIILYGKKIFIHK
ncbi:MAG: hypothetical protein NT085_00970 [candidate division SR1 bacterium]|nr:hypothetical protein [candidate division SR1 bacterium]